MLRRFGRPLLLAAGLISSAAANAAGQLVDPSLNLATDGVRAIAVQPDGKVIIGGYFLTVGGTSRENLARLNADGTLDTTFNPGVNGSVWAVAVQPDGRILVGGGFNVVNAVPRLNIARLNPDGSVDTFNPGANQPVFAIAIQPDGKILLGGSFTGLGGGGVQPRSLIGRVNSDGTLDPSFNVGSINGTGAGVFAIAVQGDGSVVFGGQFSAVTVNPRLNLARVDGGGAIDLAFDPAPDGLVGALLLQADGKILVGGGFNTLNGAQRSRIGRLNTNGSVDAGFDPGANSNVSSFAVQADGRIVVGGTFSTLGGGGTGTSTRLRLGRLNQDGTLDGGFDPGANGIVLSMALQADGRLLVGGFFTGLGGGTGATARAGLGRLLNTATATESLTLSTGAGTITWLRGASSPDVSWMEFSWSTDGVTYASLGAGTRVAGGWQIASVPFGSNLRIRARAAYATGQAGGSGSMIETLAPASNTNTVGNGDFSSGGTNWLQFATPDMSYIQSNVSSGVFQFYRVAPPPGTTNQAVVFQQTNMPMPARGAVEASFRIGNADTVRKRISVLVHDADFTDLSVCTFWLPAGAPLATYIMQTHTTKAWTNATISFYAASANSPGNTTGFYRLDDVTLEYRPAGYANATVCRDPYTPPAPGGSPSLDLIVNGSFTSGLAPWTTFGNITGTIANGVLQFIKQPGTPAGVVLQATGQPIAANQILTAFFQLGNSSPVRKRVTVILHDNNFSDLSACTFWMPPGQPLTYYGYETYTTQAWTNATLSVYPATVGNEQWILADDVSLQVTPASTIFGTHCSEPAFAGDVEPPGARRLDGRAPGQLEWRVAASDSRVGLPQRSGEPVVADGFLSVDDQAGGVGATWVAEAPDSGRSTLILPEPIDLSTASAARLTFASWLVSLAPRAAVEVSVDGVSWQSLARLTPSDTWMPVSIDLSAYHGEIVMVRFAFDRVSPGPGLPPDVWRITGIRLDTD